MRYNTTCTIVQSQTGHGRRHRWQYSDTQERALLIRDGHTDRAIAESRLRDRQSGKKSATSRNGRTELQTLLDFLRSGDTLMVTRIDRLARSIGDLQDIVRLLKGKGVELRATEQPVDTGTAAGKAFVDMLGVFAEFETNLRRERQLKVLLERRPQALQGPTSKD